MNTEAWRNITLPQFMQKTEWGATTESHFKYTKHFTENHICWQYDESDNNDHTKITYKIYCTEEELLVIRLHL